MDLYSKYLPESILYFCEKIRTKIQILYPLNLLNTASMLHVDNMFTIVYVQAKSYAHYVGMFMTYRSTTFHTLPRLLH